MTVSIHGSRATARARIHQRCTHVILVAVMLATALCMPATAALAFELINTFDTEPTGSAPSGWTVSTGGGSVTVQEFPSSSDKSLTFVDTSTSNKVTAHKDFAATASELSLRYNVRAVQTTETSGVSLRNSSGTNAVTVALDATGSIYTYTGSTKTTIQSYTANTWYEIEIVARPANDTFDVYINDVKKVDNQPFRTPTANLSNVFLNSSDATTGTEYYNYINVSTAEQTASFPEIGVITPRAANQISDSNWSIGAETLDRDYAVYDNYKAYLGPLGAKKVRLQGGWAKTEQTPGVYSWAWLDAIVNDAVAQGVKPWIQTSYGNTIYAGGGETGLGGGIPTSAPALTAWDNWVRALVQRYKDRVDEWEVWNEPDHGGTTAIDYAALYVRTAAIIRSEQPSAKIYALALAGIDTTYTATFLNYVQAQGKLSLIDTITYHGYAQRPERQYSAVQALRNTIAQYSSTITIRQGENGAPSRQGGFGALSGHHWTELTQAKWNMRRMLGDLGRDIPSSVFTIADLRYPTDWNDKGLLKVNTDLTVAYRKQAYYAVQNITALFDNTVARIPNYSYAENTSSSISVFGYAKSGSSKQIVTIWLDNATPSDSNETTPVTFTFHTGNFADPMYVDVRTGKIYDIPDANWSKSGSSYTFTDMPIYDSPILIADKSVVMP